MQLDAGMDRVSGAYHPARQTHELDKLHRMRREKDRQIRRNQQREEKQRANGSRCGSDDDA